jgi:hypothetical protein
VPDRNDDQELRRKPPRHDRDTRADHRVIARPIRRLVEIELVADEVTWVDEHVARLRIGSVDTVWCSLRHPARNWGQLGRSYLHEGARPALETARDLAAKA